jgi:TrmH family RNA methyltransferase
MLSKSQIKFIKSLELKKYRKSEGLFVAEGPKVVGDLLEAGWTPHSIFATADYQYPGVCTQTVTLSELQRISFLQHPQKVLATFLIPSQKQIAPSLDKLTLALDGVQDPGNLGTIIRIADWFGIDTVYCSNDTADVYNPKVVQATMGSLAHMSIIYSDLEELFDHLPGNYPVYGTLLDGNDIYKEELSTNGMIVMGNEGNGISETIRRRVTHRLLIPNFNSNRQSAESLNVAIATAITCSEFMRRH